MLTYETLKRNPKKLLALTGLARREFEELLPAFAEALAAAARAHRPKRAKRQRAPGAGRKPNLRTVADKLLFVLVYTKTYPLQVVQGQMFAMSQSSASEWLHCLLPVLADALDRLGVMPEREAAHVARHERRQVEAPDLIVDGVERRRQRPKDAKIQAMHYSGKRKTHGDKNLVLTHTRSQRVSYLSPTFPGAANDKTLAEYLAIRYPPRTTLRSDLGFEGYRPARCRHLQPKQSPSSRN
jgi:hypothetical protein